MATSTKKPPSQQRAKRQRVTSKKGKKKANVKGSGPSDAGLVVQPDDENHLDMVAERCREKLGIASRMKDRPLTDELIGLIAEMVARGCYGYTAAKFCGVSSTAWNRWRSLNTKARAKLESGKPIESLTEREERALRLWCAVRDAEAEAEATLVQRIYQASADDWRAGSWMLARRHPQRWGAAREKPDVNINVNAASGAGVMVLQAASGYISQNPDDWQEQFSKLQVQGVAEQAPPAIEYVDARVITRD